LITVFLVSFASFIGLLVWRVDDIMFSDKLAWSEAQSRSQMSPLIHSLEIELSNLSETLAISLPQIREAKKDYTRGTPLARYQMVAGLKNLGQKEWTLERPIFLEQAPAKQWAQQYVTLLLKTIDARDIKPGAIAAYSLLDPQRKSYLFLIHNMVVVGESGNSKQTQWVGVLVGPEMFQSLMDRQKGQISSVFLVNQLGQALGHTTPEYVGNLLTEDPIVSELMKAQTGNGSGTFKNLKGESIQGFYEQVERSNVFAVITTPVGALLKNRDQVRLQILMLGFGLAFIGTAIFVFIYRADNNSNKKATVFVPPPPTGPQKVVVTATPAASAPALPTPVSVPLATPVPPAPPSLSVGSPSALPLPTAAEGQPADKMEVFLRMASALSHELRGPLSAILGHVQLLKAHPGSEEHLGGIEDQARKSRDLLQKLMIFSGEDAPRFQRVKLTDLVRKALRQVDALVFRKGVHVNIEDLREIEAFDLPADLVCRSIENILMNSIEAMERAAKKDLKISLIDDNGKVKLTISDTGEGIEASNLNKVFEPFFTTRGRQFQAGLGLSMSLGIVKELNGNISIESERGKGTTVTIVLDPSQIVATIVPNDLKSSSASTTPEHQLKAPPLPPPSPKATMMILEDQEVEEVLGLENVTASELAKLSPPPIPTVIESEAQEPTRSEVVPAPEFDKLKRDEKDLAAHQAVIAANKIDKPKIQKPLKVSRLDQVAFQIRRPNEKGFEKSGDKS